MAAAPSFTGRLFGPGIPGAGITLAGHWQDDSLVLRGGDVSLAIPGTDLQIEAAGFNAQQVRLSWQTAQGDFAFFVEQAGECERFFAHAPQAVVHHVHNVKKQRRGLHARFGAALLIYGMLLLSPLILLVIFLMNSDRLAGWVAEKVPPKYEAKIGDMVLAQTRARMQLLESGPAVEAVQEIGAKLTKGSRYRYRWAVAESREVNAFAAPGGVIVVYTGLIDKAARPEELAGVLAHEVAHVEQRHSLKNLIKSAGFGVLLSVALGDWSGSVVGGRIGSLTDLKFSRDAEEEADREGLRRLVEASIAPEHMANFFARLAQSDGKASEALSMLSTHPSSRERTQTLRQQILALPQKQYEPLHIDWPAVKASIRQER